MLDISLYDNIIITNKVDAALQELDILFSTTPTEMIGNTTYGVNFLQFLWQLTPSESILEQYIFEKIEANTLYAKKLRHDISVNALYDEAEMIYVVSIVLYESRDDKVGKSKQYIVRP